MENNQLIDNQQENIEIKEVDVKKIKYTFEIETENIPKIWLQFYKQKQQQQELEQQQPQQKQPVQIPEKSSEYVFLEKIQYDQMDTHIKLFIILANFVNKFLEKAIIKNGITINRWIFFRESYSEKTTKKITIKDICSNQDYCLEFTIVDDIIKEVNMIKEAKLYVMQGDYYWIASMFGKYSEYYIKQYQENFTGDLLEIKDANKINNELQEIKDFGEYIEKKEKECNYQIILELAPQFPKLKDVKTLIEVINSQDFIDFYNKIIDAGRNLDHFICEQFIFSLWNNNVLCIENTCQQDCRIEVCIVDNKIKDLNLSISLLILDETLGYRYTHTGITPQEMIEIAQKNEKILKTQGELAKDANITTLANTNWKTCTNPIDKINEDLEYFKQNQQLINLCKMIADFGTIDQIIVGGIGLWSDCNVDIYLCNLIVRDYQIKFSKNKEQFIELIPNKLWEIKEYKRQIVPTRALHMNSNLQILSPDRTLLPQKLRQISFDDHMCNEVKKQIEMQKEKILDEQNKQRILDKQKKQQLILDEQKKQQELESKRILDERQRILDEQKEKQELENKRLLDEQQRILDEQNKQRILDEQNKQLILDEQQEKKRQLVVLKIPEQKIAQTLDTEKYQQSNINNINNNANDINNQTAITTNNSPSHNSTINNQQQKQLQQQQFKQQDNILKNNNSANQINEKTEQQQQVITKNKSTSQTPKKWLTKENIFITILCVCIIIGIFVIVDQVKKPKI